MGKFSKGEYKLFYKLYINDKPIGEKLPLRIIVKEKMLYNELEQNIDKIKDFRENFNLSEEEYSDERLLEVLKENNFEFKKSFENLF